MIDLMYSSTETIDLPLQSIKRVMAERLKKSGIIDNVGVELRIVGEATMRRLNQRYRQHNKPTDVLSFPIWHDLNAIREQSGPILLGSIIVCLPVAEQDAQKEHVALQAKIESLIEHSLEHLLGFHHPGD